jgi:hypothetical protein
VAGAQRETQTEIDALAEMRRERQPGTLADGRLLGDFQALFHEVFHLGARQCAVHRGRNGVRRGHGLDARIEVEAR